MSSAESDDTEVEFLLDGEEFFAEFRAQVDAVVAAPAAAGTYLRLAYWAADAACPLGPGGPTLIARLTAAAAAGHQVDIIVYAAWEATAVRGMTGDVIERLVGPAQRQQAQQAADQMAAGATALQTAVNLANAGLGGGAVPMRIYLEPINRWVPGASNHQKVLIASIGGQRTCLIGGFNLLASYYDVVAHDRALYPLHWHDTAVRVRGPATADVEREWLRRWTKSGLPAAANATAQVAYADPQTGATRVAIATTNAEGWFRETDIQARLVREIAAATDYIYFENYGFTDPTLVDALIARLAAPAPPTLIVNLNNNWPADEAAFKWFNYVSWAKLALSTCTTCTVPDPGGLGGPLVLTRATATRWRLRQDWNFWSTWRSISSGIANRNLEDDALEWALPDGRAGTTRLRDLIAVDGGVRFYAPTAVVAPAGPSAPAYLHSKLALFDDRVAMVGTANLTYRSMVYDGEIVAFIDDARVAAEIRARLFSHWNPRLPLTPDNWDLIATVNAIEAPDRTYVRPLTIADLSQVPPQNPLGFTWM